MKVEVICAECQQSVPREATIQFGNRFICGPCKPRFIQRLREGAILSSNGIVYAGFWVRFWASLIDGILVVVITYPILISVYGWEYFDLTTYGFIAGPIDLLVSWLLPAIWTVAFWIGKQATPGKMLCAVKIVDARRGARPSITQFMIRYLMYFVSVLPLGLGFIWVAFDERKQGWHDKIAETMVIRSKKRPPQDR